MPQRISTRLQNQEVAATIAGFVNEFDNSFPSSTSLLRNNSQINNNIISPSRVTTQLTSLDSSELKRLNENVFCKTNAKMNNRLCSSCNCSFFTVSFDEFLNTKNLNEENKIGEYYKLRKV